MYLLPNTHKTTSVLTYLQEYLFKKMCRGHNVGNETISVEAQFSHIWPFNVVIRKMIRMMWDGRVNILYITSAPKGSH